jgi:hypothetical protein
MTEQAFFKMLTFAEHMVVVPPVQAVEPGPLTAYELAVALLRNEPLQ